jgi:hypothetical protein
MLNKHMSRQSFTNIRVLASALIVLMTEQFYTQARIYFRRRLCLPEKRRSERPRSVRAEKGESCREIAVLDERMVTQSDSGDWI